ncbi:MAG TPA: ABC transporter ATP-binding protein [Acidimicrobiales bacterium]|nr:ABC transporter ATP-binding protein [Acidimicrobiales bacterium]
MPETLANLGVMLRSSWRADRTRSIGALLATALVPVTRPLRAIGLGVMADGIVAQDSGTALRGVAIVAGLTAANRMLDWASVTVRMRLREHTILFLDEEVIELSARAPSLEHHERPEHQDQMELLRSDRHYLVNPFMPIAWSLAAVVQLVATIAVFAGLHPALGLLPLAGVPALVLGLRAEAWWEDAREQTAQDSRLGIHLMELATQPAAGKEVRIFDLGDELVDRYQELMRRIERRHAAVDVRAALTLSVAWALFAVAYMTAVGFVAGQVVDGALSVGAVVLTLSLGAQINGQLAELVDNATWFSRTSRAVSRYRWLTRYVAETEAATAPARPAAAPDTLRDGITFAGVAFAYPGTDRPVLDGVDLHLPAGSTVAIVGENGAGKTTLVKLLLRFYEPTAGRITVDGVDLADIPVDDWRVRTSGAFQDFAHLQLVARHSIGVGWLPHADDDAAVAEATTRAAAGDLHQVLPQGLATQLGREFEDGTELSIGQWQKVAVSRAMMRAAPLLLVLDEPTASLDAPTEHELFDHFTGVARVVAQETGAITVLVSHRFSTVRTADLVVVVAGNRVAETGTHEELVARPGGLYAELYGLQARSYT